MIRFRTDGFLRSGDGECSFLGSLSSNVELCGVPVEAYSSRESSLSKKSIHSRGASGKMPETPLSIRLFFRIIFQGVLVMVGGKVAHLVSSIACEIS